MDFLVRLTGEDISCGNLTHAQFSRQPVSRSHGDTDIPVRDDSHELLIGSYDGQHPAVAHPHELNHGAHIGLGTTTYGRLRHDLFYFHDISLSSSASPDTCLVPGT